VLQHLLAVPPEAQDVQTVPSGSQPVFTGMGWQVPAPVGPIVQMAVQQSVS
jgi:hypothetical protein